MPSLRGSDGGAGRGGHDDDRLLARRILRLVADLLDWLADRQGEDAAPDAIAAMRQHVDRVISGYPAAQRARLLAGPPRSAALPTVVGILVDLVWWLDTCDDDVVDPDLAVKMLESVGAELDTLSPGHRDRLIEVLAGLAESEEDDGRRYQLFFFPFGMGLVDHAPARPSAPRSRPAD